MKTKTKNPQKNKERKKLNKKNKVKHWGLGLGTWDAILYAKFRLSSIKTIQYKHLCLGIINRKKKEKEKGEKRKEKRKEKRSSLCSPLSPPDEILYLPLNNHFFSSGLAVSSSGLLLLAARAAPSSGIGSGHFIGCWFC